MNTLTITWTMDEILDQEYICLVEGETLRSHMKFLGEARAFTRAGYGGNKMPLASSGKLEITPDGKLQYSVNIVDMEG